MTDDEIVEVFTLLTDLHAGTKGANRERIDRIREILQGLADNLYQKGMQRKGFKYSYKKFSPQKEIGKILSALGSSIALQAEAEADEKLTAQKTQDLLHAIELLEIDTPEERNRIFEELREIRKFRRECKDFQELNSPLCILAKNNQVFLQAVKSVQSVMLSSTQEMNERVYHPRTDTSMSEAFMKAQMKEAKA